MISVLMRCKGTQIIPYHQRILVLLRFLFGSLVSQKKAHSLHSVCTSNENGKIIQELKTIRFPLAEARSLLALLSQLEEARSPRNFCGVFLLRPACLLFKSWHF